MLHIWVPADAQHAEHFLDVDIFSSVLPLLFDNFQKTPIAKLQATKEKYLTREKSSSLTRLSAIFLAIITSDPSTRLRISSTCEHRRLVPAAYDYLRSWWDLASKGPDDLAFKRSVTDEVDTPADTVDDEINEVMPIIDMLYNLSCFSDDSLRLEPSDCGDKVVKLLISICKICRDGDDRKSKVLIVLAKIGSDLEGANGSSGGLPWSVLVTGSHVDICLDLICLVPFSSKKWSFDESSLLLTKAASCATVRRLISAVTESSSNLKENSFIFEQIDLFCTKRRLLHAIEMISKSFGQAAWCFADIISLPFIRFQHTSPSLPYTILDLLQSDDSSSPWKVRTAVALLSAAVQKAGIGSDRGKYFFLTIFFIISAVLIQFVVIKISKRIWQFPAVVAPLILEVQSCFWDSRRHRFRLNRSAKAVTAAHWNWAGTQSYSRHCYYRFDFRTAS